MGQRDRRYEVSEAAWRVIVREGLDRTSMRAIAHELACTTGVVTHYFRDKQDLILFALHQVTQALLQGMRAVQQQPLGCDRLVAMLLTFLPLDTKQRDILKVWVAFLGYAVGRPELMAEHQRSAGELRALVMAELQALQGAQYLRADLDPAVEANALLALVNGLGLDSLIQAQCLNLEQQQQVVQRYVERLQ
ncbi:TetR family transcriptional regulator [Synechococcales cyanobacterium C]|uniref:TetR family transcriptional regulator n=1 Tax=Petrachloros mirabilis ULC683 TaxID=2781853 RepID=A0A8K1ZZ28_9CYAN|nr:TetR/AcrR family transcriptional regulator [Petrachloros mirabilis]NCJ06322.1 TetR family transcriptional regulator [Petrachloros mirabilis ULC683]